MTQNQWFGLGFSWLSLPLQNHVAAKGHLENCWEPPLQFPYRAGSGPEQGFPCVVFPHREKPVFNTGFPGDENRFFPVGNTTQGKPCFHNRDGFAVHLGEFLAVTKICADTYFMIPMKNVPSLYLVKTQFANWALSFCLPWNLLLFSKYTNATVIYPFLWI